MLSETVAFSFIDGWSCGRDSRLAPIKTRYLRAARGKSTVPTEEKSFSMRVVFVLALSDRRVDRV